MAAAPQFPYSHDQDSRAPAARGFPPRCAHCGEAGRFVSTTARLARCSACRSLVPVEQPHAAVEQFALPETSPIAVGDVLRNRYRMIEFLGHGAHGLTYRAEHEFLNHPVVVKLLPQRIENASDTAVRRLRNEASAGFRVNDPHVVRVLDCDAIDGMWYFVTEFVDGCDLAAAADRRVLVDWRQAIRIAADAARGLAAIHAAGLIHRDIKPGNLLLGTNGRVRVGDLGVVGFIERHAAHPADSGVERVGTLAYAAPEMFASPEDATLTADLYSLGATLFHLVTGRTLRGGGGAFRALLETSAPPTWPKDAPADVPDWLIAAILRLLDPTPTERFASAAELLDQLERPGAGARTNTPQPRGDDALVPRGLVVLPFENGAAGGENEWLGHALADHLARAISSIEGAHVADREQFTATLERITAEHGGEPRERLRDAGRLIGAATIIEGRFQTSGPNIEFSARIHNADSAQPFDLEPVRGELADLAKLEARLVEGVARSLGLTPSESAPEARSDGVLAAQERFFSSKRAFRLGDYKVAMQSALEAIELEPDYGEAVGMVGICAARMGQYEHAEEYYQREEAIAERQGDQRLRLEATANRGAMHYFRGDYAAANEQLQQAANVAETLGLSNESAMISNNLGFVLLQLGQPPAAERAFRRAIERHKSYGALVALIAPYNGIGNVLREEQRYDEARDYFSRALALAQESDDRVNVGVAYMNLGQCAMLQGRLADAKHELALALNVLEETRFWNGQARVYEHMAELNLRLGGFAEAMRCIDKRIELTQLHNNRPMEAAAWRQKARTLRMEGREREADDCEERARAAEEES